jgi:hypothetical protein
VLEFLLLFHVCEFLLDIQESQKITIMSQNLTGAVRAVHIYNFQLEQRNKTFSDPKHESPVATESKSYQHNNKYHLT